MDSTHQSGLEEAVDDVCRSTLDLCEPSLVCTKLCQNGGEQLINLGHLETVQTFACTFSVGDVQVSGKGVEEALGPIELARLAVMPWDEA